MDLELVNVTKKFGSKTALDKASFRIPAGKVTGFAGNNGAGKSTAIRLIMGLATQDEGQITSGGSLITAKDRRLIGYVPEERGLYADEKVDDQLIYIARAFGLSKERAKVYVDRGLEQFNLNDYRRLKLKDLSLGNQQRVQIVCALLGDPQALVLDEPFSGLDPNAVADLADILRVIARSGRSVLFSSHQLDIVEDLSDRLVMIRDGRILVEDDVATLTGARQFRLIFEDDFGVHHERTAETSQELIEIMSYLRENQFAVVDLTSKKTALIDVFRESNSKVDSDQAALAADPSKNGVVA